MYVLYGCSDKLYCCNQDSFHIQGNKSKVIICMPLTFSFKTLGCKLNQYDSSKIISDFINNGWEIRPFGEKVDIVVVNTCTVTAHSEKKCRNYIRQAAKFSNCGKVIVTGCMANDQKQLDSLTDFILPYKNEEKSDILNAIKFSGLIEYEKEADTSLLVNRNKKNRNNSRTRGFIKIQDGCDGECTYCVVPSVRGLPRSRKFNEIIDEAAANIDEGCPELILTGITIGKYNYDGKDLADLMSKLSGLGGNFRIRLSSIEPKHITSKLLEVFESDKVCKHIHIPLQSGSDKVLSDMKRPYNISEFVKIIEDIRFKYDDLCIGTDIILGFPSETTDDFNDTVRIVNQCNFSYVHQFTFSSRSNTHAAKIKKINNAKTVSERYSQLKEITNMLNFNYRSKFLNKMLSAVVESGKKKNEFKATSDNYIKIFLNETELIRKYSGKLTTVKILSVTEDQTFGIVTE